jgi:hypothetical protein
MFRENLVKIENRWSSFLLKLNISTKASGGSFFIMHYLDHVLIKIIIKETPIYYYDFIVFRNAEDNIK